MKKSFMNNIKNFVDSNVRQRIDRVAHNYSEPFSDDILAVERHFEDIRQVCIDADKKISALLQSIQLASNQSHLGAYTQNVQAGLNNLSQNIGLPSANITSPGSNSHLSSAQSFSSNSKLQNQTPLKVSQQQLAISGDSKLSTASNSAHHYRSNESLSNKSNTLTNSHESITSHPNVETNSQPIERLSEDVQQRYKKLPVVGFYKFLVKSGRKLRPDSLLAITLSQCSQLQIQLTNLYLTYEKLIETQCLKPIQLMIETDIPNVIKLRKLYIKSHNDYEFLKSKYNGASLKQLQQQQSQQIAQPGHFANSSYLVAQSGTQPSNTNKLDQLKNELDEAVTRFEQARDTYEAELYGLVCRETELVNLLRMFYRYQAEYHQQVATIMQASLPTLNDALALTPRKPAFGTKLSEHLRCVGRDLSPVIELCTHFLNLQGLKEEGLFRIPGSSVRIKKLRNGINAWFLSLASLEELEIDQKQSGDHCISALYDLFKSAVGQRMHLSQNLQQAASVSSVVVKSTLAVDETVLNQTNFSVDNSADSNELILDVHSIAGLLKLYLRELPEPLCTFALYDDWIRCVDNKSDNDSRLKLMAAVIEKLPPSHRTNLGHIVKFLQQLTRHKDRNKMTSSNLAIAMAPSLMWPRTIEVDQQSDCNSDSANSVNMQMSTFGISASHHALILEALINSADSLFPEPSDFSLPGFANLKLDLSSRDRCSTRSRSVKSTSPTGMSTASSSSYSSNTSNNLSTSSGIKGHSRKGGSMEGLLANQDVASILPPQNPSIRSAGRPVSVQIQRDEYSASLRHQKPPPKPPIPTIRSQSRQASSDDQTVLAPPRSHNKPPAPPVPPPTTVRHHLERLRTANSVSSSSNESGKHKPRPVSLRGTGVIETTSSSSSNHQVLRPAVPPPDRPQSKSNELERADKDLAKLNLKQQGNGVFATNGSCDSTNDATLVEANDGKKSSASSVVVSLDSVSEGDSSFDNESDCHSLEQASTDGALISKQTPAPDDDDVEESKGDTIGRSERRKPSECDGGNKQAPVKPPRGSSPKAALSTPL